MGVNVEWLDGHHLQMDVYPPTILVQISQTS